GEAGKGLCAARGGAPYGATVTLPMLSFFDCSVPAAISGLTLRSGNTVGKKTRTFIVRFALKRSWKLPPAAVVVSASFLYFDLPFFLIALPWSSIGSALRIGEPGSRLVTVPSTLSFWPRDAFFLSLLLSLIFARASGKNAGSFVDGYFGSFF